MSNSSSMNFQAYLKDAWKIIKQEPFIFVGGGFLYQLLFFLSQGLIFIIAGPLLGGYLLAIILYIRENKRPTFKDLFSGFKEFGNLFPYLLILLIIFIGFALLILPGLIFSTWWIYVLPLMVDRKMPFNVAMRTSMNKVNEKGFFMHLVFLLLISMIPLFILLILSSVIHGLMVLSILLPPLQFGCLASLYIDQFGRAEPDSSAAPVETGTAPLPTESTGPEPADTEVPPQQAGTAADLTDEAEET